MRILFLDDSKMRHDYASEWFPKEAVLVRAYSAPEAVGLYLLMQNSYTPFDLVSLDHDLGCQYDFDGRNVVDSILLLHDKLTLPKPKFAIHSWNIPCAEQMWWKLKLADFEVTRDPFQPKTYLQAYGDQE
jgi:CheY-like chemotaxis protein